MSYSSQVLALPGLVGYWPCNEAAGATTLTDSGPNNITLTLVSSLTQGPEQVVGLGSSLRGDGVQRAASATNIAALATPAAFTFGIWVSVPTGDPGTAARVLIGRNNVARIATGKSNRLLFGTWSPSGGTWVGTAATTVTGLSTRPVDQTVPTFVMFSFNGSEVTIWVNGKKDQQYQCVGAAVPTPTAALEILAVGGGSIATADVSGAFMLNRAITATEGRSLFEAGTKLTLPADGAPLDYQLNNNAAVAANLVDGTGCAACGGRRRSNESSIVTTTGTFHIGCYGARISARPFTTITNTSTKADYATMSARLLWDMIWRCSKRTGSGDEQYLDPTTLLPVSLDHNQTDVTSASMWRSFAGIATSGASLWHYSRAPRDHWLVTLAKNILNAGIDTKFMIVSDIMAFFAVELGQCLLLLNSTIDKATKDKWTTALVAWGNDWVNNQKFYYTNGNIELQEVIGLWCLWKVTGNRYWLTQYQFAKTWTVSPTSLATANGANNINGGGNGSQPFGWVVTQTATKADGSDGKGYFGESANSGNPAFNGITGPGYDGDYATYQMTLCTRLYQLTADPDYLYYANMLLNAVMDHVNTTTWINDATAGSRHNAAIGFNTNTPQAVNFIGRAANQWDPALVASHWVTATHDQYIINLLPTNENQLRGTATDIAGMLWSQPDWPAFY